VKISGLADFIEDQCKQVDAIERELPLLLGANVV
jgi:hypothetical protein